MSDRHTLRIEEVCPTCKNIIPEGFPYCRECAAPQLPSEALEAGLSRGKTVARIALITAIFAAVVMARYDIKMDDLFPVGQETEVTADEIPQDDDYKVAHGINVSHANVRNTPSSRGKIVIVVNKGDSLEILDRGESWTQIKIKEQTGWIATRLLTTTIE